MINIKKLLAVGIILFFISIAVAPSITAYKTSGVGNTVYVDDDNTSGPWDGSQEHPYQRIQDAINAADNGDTVFVHSGTYFENVEIKTTNICLTGEDKSTTIIDGGNSGNVVYVAADWTGINAFTIQGGGDYECAGIYIISNYNVIFGNVITTSNSYGIHLYDSSNSTISENNIKKSDSGIYVDYSSNIKVSSNSISNCRRGIYIHGGSDNVIKKNDVTYHSKENSIGILIWWGSYHNTISGNSVSNSNVGILIGYLANCTISGNCIKLNQLGISIEGTIEVTVSNNNFLTNTMDAYFTKGPYSPYHDNKWKQNYWSEPRVFPKLIHGVLLFIIPPEIINIPWINFDWHPRLVPYVIPPAGCDII